MLNRTLHYAESSKRYYPVLRQITGSISGAILMAQLDYWFARYEDGFYKYLQPCEDCREGDSWGEELGFSPSEFNTAFKKIGIKYKSKSDFDDAGQKFINNGKEYLYASYHNKVTGQTFYYRNHELVDKKLSELMTVPPKKSNSGNTPKNKQKSSYKSTIINNQSTPPVTQQSSSTEINNVKLHSITMNNTINTKKKIYKRKKIDQPAFDKTKFEDAWSKYPQRIGGNSKPNALKAWQKLVSEGVSEDDLISAASNYALECDTSDSTGTQYVKEAGRFYGPGRYYEEYIAYDLTKLQNIKRGKQNELRTTSDKIAASDRLVKKYFSDVRVSDIWRR